VLERRGLTNLSGFMRADLPELFISEWR
jgi:hypothetical protein